MSHFWEILKALGPWGLPIVSTVESLGIPNPGGTGLAAGVHGDRPSERCRVVRRNGGVGIADRNRRAFFDVMQRGGEKLAGEVYVVRNAGLGSGPGFNATRLSDRCSFQRWCLCRSCHCKAFTCGVRGGDGCEPVEIPGRTGGGKDILRYSGLAYLGVKLGTVENSKAWVKAHTWHMAAFASLGFFCFFIC